MASISSRMALLLLASLVLLGSNCGVQAASQPRRLQQAALRCAAGQGVQTIRGTRVCVPCARGTWSAGGNNVACTACTAGTTTPGNSSTSARACTLCLPGWGFAAGKCSQCARGTYSAVTGNVPCVACGTGYTNAGPGATSAQGCKVCAAGYGAVSPNVCTLCSIGSWSSITSGPCTPCPSDQTTNSTGATSKAACIKLVVPPARDVLLAAKQQLLGGAQAAPGRCEATMSWTNTTNVCTWTGISCDKGGSVVGIDLAMQNCGGFVPAALSQLPSLRSLVLEANFLNGGIPPRWAALTKLSFLNLASNNLNTSLPGADFATLPSLATIMLTGNFLPGPLPAAWASMPALKELSLDYNALSGTVPTEWGAPAAMVKLQSLIISDNPALSGCFPRRLAERLGRRDVATDQEFIDGLLYNTNISTVCA